MSSTRILRNPQPGAVKAGTSAAVGFLIFLEFGSGLLQGWLGPLLPAIGATHGASAASLNWIMAIYLLATVVAVPILAKLGDMFGHKKLLVFATAAVAAGSLLVAFAPSYEWLLVGRALQAPLGAFLPLEFAIVRHRDPENAGKSIGRLVGALTLGGVAGGLISGAVMDALDSLTLTLLVPGVFLALCIPVVKFLVPETTLLKKGSIDWLGAALLGLGMLALLGGVSNGNALGWTNPLVIGGIGLGLSFLVAWVLVERSVKHPLIDLHVLTRGIGLPVLMSLLVGAQMFASNTPSSLFLRADPANGYGFGLSASTAGLVLASYAFALFVGSTFSDNLATRLGAKSTIIGGGILSAVGYLLMVFWPGTVLTFSAWLFVSGVASGILIGVLPTVIVKRAPADSVGIASAMYNTSRSVGGAVAGAGFVLVMSSLITQTSVNGAPSAIPSHDSYRIVWSICAAICLVVSLMATRLKSSKSVETAGSQGNESPSLRDPDHELQSVGKSSETIKHEPAPTAPSAAQDL
ncbi:MFS transporter [Paenarthrobacter sp. NPDC089322]|uniref:MFS transporter n=1 Tax=Paenarthrobacter sp. NPDC089322 TaxID=3155065 RepID=UPI003431D7BD